MNGLLNKKTSKVTSEYDEYNIQLQNLAKTQHKSQEMKNGNNSSKKSNNSKETSKTKNIFEDIYLNKDNSYREEIIKWYYHNLHRLSSLSQEEFNKTLVIDDKTISGTIKEMYLVRKNGKRYKYMAQSGEKRSYSDYRSDQELKFNSGIIRGPLQEHFECRIYDKEKEEDYEKNFLSSLRIFDLSEKDDSITFGEEYCNYNNLIHYFKVITNDKVFSTVCRTQK